MKICMIGTGYVGLVTGTCFAEMGNDVVCVDVDRAKIERLQRGRSPIFEPGLQEMLRRNLNQGRLGFTTDLSAAVQASRVIFIAVGTPPGERGEGDLRFVMAAARQVADAVDSEKLVVLKSTVPVGTTHQVQSEIQSRARRPVELAVNPEFLKEGAAVEDFMRPDRVIIGTDYAAASAMLRELYAPFLRSGAPLLVMDPRSAEMTKYAANAMLATRISFMNEIANLSDALGADVHWVRLGVGLDPRVGRHFLFPGIGFGGSCFPKDLAALAALGQEHGCPLDLIPAVSRVNQRQRDVLVDKMLRHYGSRPAAQAPADAHVEAGRGDRASAALAEPRAPQAELAAAEAPFAGKRFAVWGLAFKPQTDDIREAPSLAIIQRLLQLGAEVTAYDPEAMPPARRILGGQVRFAADGYEALKNADAVVLVTEWHQFRNPDFEKMKSLLKAPVIFDGRNQYDPAELRQLGFVYFGIGRP